MGMAIYIIQADNTQVVRACSKLVVVLDIMEPNNEAQGLYSAKLPPKTQFLLIDASLAESRAYLPQAPRQVIPSNNLLFYRCLSRLDIEASPLTLRLELKDPSLAHF